MLLGLAVLAQRWHVGPRSGQTVLSQIMGIAVGRHWAYYVVSLTITLVLSLAANTSFGGLPVLASLLARDNYLPHLFSLRGDRQVFVNGIIALSIFAGVLIVAVDGNTNSLIPLFAIGVFTGFTLAQSGLVVHWWRDRPSGWRPRAAINVLGATITALATVVFLLSKFTEGAWVVAITVPTFVFLFRRIHAYYARVAVDIGLGIRPPHPRSRRCFVIVPVTAVSRLSEHAVAEALSLGGDVVAITVALGGDEERARTEALRDAWATWNPGVALQILSTEYASIVDPIVAFIDRVRAEHDEQIVVLIPVVIPTRARYRFLHKQLDVVLTAELRRRDDVIVARVGIPLGESVTETPFGRPASPRTAPRARTTPD